jgi:hypothetical protein
MLRMSSLPAVWFVSFQLYVACPLSCTIVYFLRQHLSPIMLQLLAPAFETRRFYRSGERRDVEHLERVRRCRRYCVQSALEIETNPERDGPFHSVIFNPSASDNTSDVLSFSCICQNKWY